MKAYLDNGATTVVSDKVVQAITEIYTSVYGNPSSMHKMGVEAERYLKEAKRTLAKMIKATPEEIIFTSGGTEANNLAIKGVLEKSRKRHIITSAIEHPSVLNVFNYYEEKGYKVDYLSVNDQGYIDLEDFKEKLTDETALVSIMHVNNELGVIQDLQSISKVIKANSKALFHVDGVQALGKVAVHVKKYGVDLMTFSSHKIHGPMGVGALFIKKGTVLEPLFIGGSQQKKVRPGTENLPGIVGFKVAVEDAMKNFDQHVKHIEEMKAYFKEEALKIEPSHLNGSDDAPHIVNISFPNMRGEVLLHTLESKDIYVSTGSACASKNKSYSHVLEAIGLDDKHKEGAIRFSFSKYTTKEIIDYAIKELKESIAQLDAIIQGR